ncbi:zinc finger protein 888-like [Tigriopus californicus]|uniref:zinc finger protein 888-like n=1 Tax=Tigriopus californicus TaxID=6832 RepID=UPI0027DA22B8|nr:zinc finger protein 888-like [Tigriopus californicus]
MVIVGYLYIYRSIMTVVSMDHHMYKVHMASSHPPVDHDYSVRQLDATVVESLQKSGAAICSSESPMSKMFAKCDKCRRSRIKVLVPNSLLSVAKGKNDGQTCDFCGTIMPPDSPQFLPNVFEGRRGCKIGDKRSDSNPLGRKRNRLKVLSGAFSLREHVNAVHLRNFEHICSHCEKSFAHFSNLNRHIRLVHKQLLVTHKYVNCSECKKVVQSSSLKKHIRSIHDKQRDFQCQYCDKNFAQSYSLKEHVGAKHTHDWSHICLLCQKTFAHRNNCGRHIRSVHKQEIKSKNFHDYMMSSQISNL